jgi:hypothetical protein
VADADIVLKRRRAIKRGAVCRAIDDGHGSDASHVHRDATAMRRVEAGAKAIRSKAIEAPMPTESDQRDGLLAASHAASFTTVSDVGTEPAA